MARISFDHCVVAVSDWERSAVEHLRSHGVAVELGPVPRAGARGEGTSVYFRDPDGSLLELIAYG